MGMLSEEQMETILSQKKVGLREIGIAIGLSKKTARTTETRDFLRDQKIIDMDGNVLPQEQEHIGTDIAVESNSNDYFSFVDQTKVDVNQSQNDEEYADMPELKVFVVREKMRADKNRLVIGQIIRTLTTPQVMNKVFVFCNDRHIRDTKQFFRNVALCVRHYESAITFGYDSMVHRFGMDITDFLHKVLAITDGDSFLDQKDVGFRLFELSAGKYGLTEEARQRLADAEARRLAELDVKKFENNQLVLITQEKQKELELKQKIHYLANKIRNLFKKKG